MERILEAITALGILAGGFGTLWQAWQSRKPQDTDPEPEN